MSSDEETENFSDNTWPSSRKNILPELDEAKSKLDLVDENFISVPSVCTKCISLKKRNDSLENRVKNQETEIVSLNLKVQDLHKEIFNLATLNVRYQLKLMNENDGNVYMVNIFEIMNK